MISWSPSIESKRLIFKGCDKQSSSNWLSRLIYSLLAHFNIIMLSMKKSWRDGIWYSPDREFMRMIEEVGRRDYIFKVPSGFKTREEYNIYKDIKSREAFLFLDKNQVKDKVVFGKDNKRPPHPYFRTMVSIESDAFKESVRIVSDLVKVAKDPDAELNQVVLHFQCCNIIWIGKRPRVNNHVVNDKFKKLIHLKNVPKAFYNPHFLPYYFDRENEEENSRTFFEKLVKMKEMEEEITYEESLLLDSEGKKIPADYEMPSHLDDEDGLLLG